MKVRENYVINGTEINDEFRKKYNLPLMIHGKSVAKPHPHGISAPSQPGTVAFEDELNDMLIMVNAARQLTPVTKDLRNVLNKYNPFEVPDVGYEGVLKAMGFKGWDELVTWIAKDKCLELYLRMEYYLDDNKVPYNKDRDFIGNEVGQYRRLADCMEATGLKMADIKYFYKHLRPLEYLCAIHHRDMRHMVNGVHPPHYDYGAWHGAKNAESLDASRRQFNFEHYKQIELVNANAYYIASMSRSGLGVHYPLSNLVGFKTAGVTECKHLFEIKL